MVSPVSNPQITLGYRQKANFDPTYIHRGIDFRAPTGTPVYASAAGKVVHAGTGGLGKAFGKHVVVEVHDDGQKVYVLVAHLSKVSVKVGQRVSTGARLGASGATGNVTAAHLHYAELTAMHYQADRRPQLLDRATTAAAMRAEREPFRGELLDLRPMYEVTAKDGIDLYAGPGKKFAVAGHLARGERFVASRATTWYRRMEAEPKLWAKKTGLRLIKATKQK